MEKRIIIYFPKNISNKKELIEASLKNGFNIIFFEEYENIINDFKGKIIALAPKNDIAINYSFNEISEAKNISGEEIPIIKIEKKEDEKKVLEFAEKNFQAIIIDLKDIKIIPLENIVALLHKKNIKIYAFTELIEEVQPFLNVLEIGIDGVITPCKNINDIEKLASLKPLFSRIKLQLVKIIDIKDVGIGDRACIDTTSMLNQGEGALIGSTSNFLFLIDNESIGSKFSAPRPFRINAGAIHSYILQPGNKTKYLSEIETGDQILIVNKMGEVKEVTVGRNKIEKRPLKLIKAMNKEVGSIIVQNAETIRFVSEDSSIPITDLKIGDKVLAYIRNKSGRHFGIEVDEHIIEK
ncbi:MAG: 3-dehydroquinate synthase II [Nitrososphaerota archaeon]